MQISALLISGILLTATPVSAATILILGDSLSASYGMPEHQGWVQLLRDKLPEHKIINASVSGETSAGALRRLPALLDSVAPELVLVELGANDGLRGFPPAQLKKNLTKIITLIKATGANVLLSDILMPPNYGKRYSQAFRRVYQEIQTEQAITLMPFFMREIAPNPDLMQKDGLHPNQAAQEQISLWVKPWIVQVLPGAQQ
ncbi:arylesterase [Shewanella sp. AS16]|uniref:arylesterase n=1 Tax=Shewanella sp. AS16 TaxID=2907625 RepID=UPI001F3089EE|nr:arylesterase [Shewanella sp. AS16]MCE9686886.1 arylesterase [Shewanella sp. AS16]